MSSEDVSVVYHSCIVVVASEQQVGSSNLSGRTFVLAPTQMHADQAVSRNNLNVAGVCRVHEVRRHDSEEDLRSCSGSASQLPLHC